MQSHWCRVPMFSGAWCRVRMTRFCEPQSLLKALFYWSLPPVLGSSQIIPDIPLRTHSFCPVTDRQSQNRTVAARVMAERKVFAHRS